MFHIAAAPPKCHGSDGNLRGPWNVPEAAPQLNVKFEFIPQKELLEYVCENNKPEHICKWV
jgi:hypothetical protein